MSNDVFKSSSMNPPGDDVRQAVKESRFKIKILDTHYEESKDLVIWKAKVFEVNGKEVDPFDRTLVWPGEDLGTALGIDKVIPPQLLIEFCDNMVGKELTLISEPDMTDEKLDDMMSKMKDSSNWDTLMKQHGFFDKYPYHEIIELLGVNSGN